MSANVLDTTKKLERPKQERVGGRVQMTVGQKIAEARKAAGFRTQFSAAQESQNFARRDPIRFAAFSPQWLSRLENDVNGSLLDGARRPQVRTLEAMLGIVLSDAQSIQASPETNPETSTVHIVQLDAHSNTAGKNLHVQVHRGYTAGYAQDLLCALIIDGTVLGSDEVRARIEQDSFVILHPTLDPRPGDIVALWLEDIATTVLTEFWPQRKLTKLSPWNELEPPITLKDETESKLRGVVISYPVLLRHGTAVD